MKEHCSHPPLDLLVVVPSSPSRRLYGVPRVTLQCRSNIRTAFKRLNYVWPRPLVLCQFDYMFFTMCAHGVRISECTADAGRVTSYFRFRDNDWWCVLEMLQPELEMIRHKDINNVWGQFIICGANILQQSQVVRYYSAMI